MTDSVTDFFEAHANVRRLFPRGFNVLSECLKHDVRAVRLKRWGLLEVPACYGEGEIILDPDTDVKRLAGVISRRNGIRIDPEDVFVWLFLHEVGHHVRRHVYKPSNRDPWEEKKAEEFAKQEFLRWKERTA